jgi:hypothetical protein
MKFNDIKSFTCMALIILMTFTSIAFAQDTSSVDFRIENFAVSPQSLPPLIIRVANTGTKTASGVLTPELPDGWEWSPSSIDTTVEPGEAEFVRFTITRGKPNATNCYPVSLSWRDRGFAVFQYQQDVYCASAPYFKPTIDGAIDDWEDAIPVTFGEEGDKTTIATFWNRRSFSLMVEVEEASLTAPSGEDDVPCDAIQFAIAPRSSEGGSADRYEFLVIPKGEGQGECRLLAGPDDESNDGSTATDWQACPTVDAEVVVARTDRGTTVYELSLSFRDMPLIRPSEGREFYFSLLVHDDDDPTGPRDWGVASGLSDSERSWDGWKRWNGDAWPDDPSQPPADSRTLWGMCSSKY